MLLKVSIKKGAPTPRRKCPAGFAPDSELTLTDREFAELVKANPNLRPYLQVQSLTSGNVKSANPKVRKPQVKRYPVPELKLDEEGGENLVSEKPDLDGENTGTSADEDEEFDTGKKTRKKKKKRR